MLGRPFILGESFQNGPPDANNLVSALTSSLSTGSYVPGSLQPVARRLGIEYVVLRNDLNWQRVNALRPSSYDPLRHDPDLTRVGTFGAPGQNLVDEADNTAEAQSDASLPPVEIYRIRDVPDVVGTVPASGSLLVSGDGAAWLPLGSDGA